MSTLWIVAANSSFAKIFEVKGLGRQIKEIQHIDFPQGRLKGTQVNSDRPGRAFDRMGKGRHALTTEVNLHEHENKVFAHQIAEVLRSAHDSHTFDQLAIVAPPHFLGELKLAINDGVRKTIIKEIGKDLPERLTEKERLDLLANYLDLWNRASSSR